jgi:hypothetical protein
LSITLALLKPDSKILSIYYLKTLSKGSEAKVNTFDELGKTVFDAFVQIRPQNNLSLIFEYDVPAPPAERGEPKNFSGNLPILIQKQPGTKDYSYTIKINGSQKSKFNLTSDQDLKLSI